MRGLGVVLSLLRGGKRFSASLSEGADCGVLAAQGRRAVKRNEVTGRDESERALKHDARLSGRITQLLSGETFQSLRVFVRQVHRKPHYSASFVRGEELGQGFADDLRLGAALLEGVAP